MINFLPDVLGLEAPRLKKRGQVNGLWLRFFSLGASSPRNLRNRIACIWLVITSLILSACASADTCSGNQSAGSTLHILFIGNSYIYVNDLPGTFARLACSGGHKVETDMAAPGGWTLAQHASSPQTLDKLKQRKWDYVILQEQSECFNL